MHSSSLQFLVEVTFNLTLVDDSAWAEGGFWKNNNILRLILSACLWSPMLSHMSIQSFSPAHNVETGVTESLSAPTPMPTPALALSSTGPALKRASSIVRGRDLPFPVVPIQRRRTLQRPPSNPRNSALLEQRYSSILLPPLPAANEDVPTRGRTLQRTTRPARPALSRSDSRTLSPESVEDIKPLSRRTSRNSTLLREPPFPLPHRVLQRPASSSPSPSRAHGNKEPRPVSKRVSSIPPPLALENIYARRLDEEDGDEDEDSPVLGKEEARRLMQRRVPAQPVVRGRRYSVSRAPQNL